MTPTQPTAVPQPRPPKPHYDDLFLEPAYTDAARYQDHDDADADEPIGSTSAP